MDAIEEDGYEDDMTLWFQEISFREVSRYGLEGGGD